MIQACSKCGCDFLTEADPYLVLPRPSGVEFNCLCSFRKLEAQNLQLKAMIKEAIEIIGEQSFIITNDEFYVESPVVTEWIEKWKGMYVVAANRGGSPTCLLV